MEMQNIKVLYAGRTTTVEDEWQRAFVTPVKLDGATLDKIAEVNEYIGAGISHAEYISKLDKESGAVHYQLSFELHINGEDVGYGKIKLYESEARQIETGIEHFHEQSKEVSRE